MAKSSLQRYASGVTAKIPVEVVEKLENAFGVPHGYIMGWQSEQEPKQQQEKLADVAAQILTDPHALSMFEDYLSLSESDRYAARLMISSLASKKKTDAGGVSQEVEKVSLSETE